MARVLYVVRIAVPCKLEKKWNRWHDQEHLPMVLAQPGFVNVRKFRAISNDKNEAEYLVLYELQNRAAYDKYVRGEDSQKLRQHYLDAYGTVTRITRWACLETFHLAK